jgi:hypothetical protein
MAVDETGDGAQAATVELLDVVTERLEVAHPADGLDPAVAREDVRILDDMDFAERRPAKRRGPIAGGRRQLGEIPHEEPPHGWRRYPDAITS